MANPKVEISCRTFTNGVWWWASTRIHGQFFSSGYCRSREVAVRRLRKELRTVESHVSFALGFLEKQ